MANTGNPSKDCPSYRRELSLAEGLVPSNVTNSSSRESCTHLVSDPSLNRIVSKGIPMGNQEKKDGPNYLLNDTVIIVNNNEHNLPSINNIMHMT